MAISQDPEWALEERDWVHVLAITRFLTRAIDYLDGMTLDDFQDSQITVDAVSMVVSQAGEHVKKLSGPFRDSFQDVDWWAIAGMRDWLVHDYDHVNIEVLYQSVMEDAPKVIIILEPIVSRIQPAVSRAENPLGHSMNPE